jgi:site-specific DNA-methyltransferase (adenine-specific)
MKFPNKKYNIIYADPPWRYNKRVGTKKTRFGGGADAHYPMMDLQTIKELPVADIAADNCALFLWTTFPYLDKQIEVINSWGFTYRTLGFSWIKTNKNNNQPFFGIGYYAKSNAEICLLGIKGKMKPITNKVSSCVIAPKGRHSKKPDVVRERIVELFGDVPRIELFARKKFEGWDCWGNEV